MVHRFLVDHVQSAKVRGHCLDRGRQRHSSLGISSRVKHLKRTSPSLGRRLCANHRDGASRQSLSDSHISGDILGMVARGCQALDRERLARKVEREAILDALGCRCSDSCIGHIIIVVDYFITVAEFL
jgi:hypothetical protein